MLTIHANRSPCVGLSAIRAFLATIDIPSSENSGNGNQIHDQENRIQFLEFFRLASADERAGQGMGCTSEKRIEGRSRGGNPKDAAERFAHKTAGLPDSEAEYLSLFRI